MEVVRGDERDFTKTEERCGKVDLLIGNSKGYKLARSRGVPLVRIGFPVHDRFGGARIRSFGYDGTLELFDRIANALIERAQEDNDVGYTYY
jgi:nitrogenase molybdenum-iron protein NifN